MDGLLAVLGLACAGAVLLLPVVSFFMGLGARSRILSLEARISSLEDDLAVIQRGDRGLPPARLPERPAPAAVVAPAPAPEPAQAPALAPEAAETPAADSPAPAPEPVVAPLPARPAPAPWSPPPSAPASPPPVSRVPPPPARPRAAPPAQPLRFERVAVWLLAGLAGLGLIVAAFLFYDIAVQRGIITPGVRYALGLMLGLGLVVGAESLWRRDYRIPAAALSGAGVGVLYTALYAGVTRYELVGNLPTFGLMAAVTAVATLLAVRHKSLLLAMLGALGGYGTPIMLSTGQNRAVALFSYLFLLNVGLLVASRRRRWPLLVLFAGLATLSIQLGWAFKFHDATQAPVGLVAPLVLGALFVAGAARRAGDDQHTSMASALAAMGVLLAVMPFLVPMEASVESAVALTEGALAAAGCTATLAAVAALYGVARIRGWAIMAAGVALLAILPLLAFSGAWSGHEPPAAWASVALVLALPLLAWVLNAGTPAPLIALGGSALASLVSAGLLLDQGGELVRWPPVLATVAGLSALSLAMGRAGLSTWAPLLGLGQAAVALFLLGGPLGERGLDGVTLASGGLIALVYLTAPFLLRGAGEDEERPLGPWLASVLAGPAVFLQLYDAWERAWGVGAIGVLPVALGLGSLGALAALVRSRSRDPSDRDLALYTAVALLFLAAAIPIQLSREWITLGWALEVAALAWVRGRLTHPLLTPFALTLAAAVSVRLLLNPDALDYHPVEGPVILNWITYTWGVPALCLLYAAPRLKGGPVELPHVLRVIAILMLFALVNLQVSHGFATDAELTFLSDQFTEEMTRSITWGAFGLGLLVAGVVARSRVIRVVAFLFLLLAAGKVFLVDLANLSGFARVGSFLGVCVFLIVAAVLLMWLERRLDADEAQARDAEKEP